METRNLPKVEMNIIAQTKFFFAKLIPEAQLFPQFFFPLFTGAELLPTRRYSGNSVGTVNGNSRQVLFSFPKIRHSTPYNEQNVILNTHKLFDIITS